MSGALRVDVAGRRSLQLQQIGCGAVVGVGELALADAVLDESREVLHLGVILVAGDICAPARDLLGGNGGRLLRLAHV